MICFAFPKQITFISKDHCFQVNSTHKLGLEFNRIQPKLTSKSPGGIKMVGRANDAAAVRLASGASGRRRTNDAAAVLLASGANGRINALLSLYTLRSIWRLISAFFLILTFPFHGKRRCMVVGSVPDLAEKGCGKEEKYQAMAGMVVRVPRKSAAAVDKEVAARRTMAIRRVAEGNEEEGGRDTVRDFSLFTTSRGDTIFTQSWTPAQDPVRGVIVLLHGLNEHSGRYNDFAKKLNANGFKVYGVDWIGHGGSDGLHAYIHSLDYAVSDMKGFLTKVQAENPDIPCFCFGHSTGGAIVLKAALDPKVQQQIAGIVLTSPAIGVQPSHPIFVILAPIFSLLLPRFQLSAANKRGIAVSRDPQALKAKYSDPLVFTGSIRIRTGYEILRVTSYLQRNVNRVTVPFFVLHGTGDSVTDPRATRKLYEEAASTDKTMKLYEGLLHDLLFEPEKEEVAESIVMWLDSRVSK